jgi:phage terminase large subunit
VCEGWVIFAKDEVNNVIVGSDLGTIERLCRVVQVHFILEPKSQIIFFTTKQRKKMMTTMSLSSSQQKKD